MTLKQSAYQHGLNSRGLSTAEVQARAAQYRGALLLEFWRGYFGE